MTHVVQVTGCELCPCFRVYLSEKGDPPEDWCKLLGREVFSFVNAVDPECPLKDESNALVLVGG